MHYDKREHVFNFCRTPLMKSRPYLLLSCVWCGKWMSLQNRFLQPSFWNYTLDFFPHVKDWTAWQAGSVTPGTVRCSS